MGRRKIARWWTPEGGGWTAICSLQGGRQGCAWVWSGEVNLHCLAEEDLFLAISVDEEVHGVS